MSDCPFGTMQIKESSWGWLAKQIGADLQTREGQIATAAAILGHAGRGNNPRERFLYSYYPVLDSRGNVCLTCKGEDGATPQQYLDDMDALIKIINAAAEPVVIPPSEEVTPEDALQLIIGGKPQTQPLFQFGGLNFDNQGRPLNYYEFGVGHGTRQANAHSGTDIFIPVGTPIYCPLDGTVRCIGTQGNPDWGQSCGSYVDESNGVGNITIMTDVGLKLTFGHMRTSDVRVGNRVQAGQRIGTSGSFSSPHLHYEVSIHAPERVDRSIGKYPDLPYFLLNPLPATAEKMSEKITVPEIPTPIIYDLANDKDAAIFGVSPDERDIILRKRITNRNGARPEVFVFHVQAGWTSGSLEHWEIVSASSTIMVQQDGSILKVIPEKHGPWTNGDYYNPSARARALMAKYGNNLNPVSLTIEAEDGGSGKINAVQKQSILWYVRDVWKRHPHLANRTDNMLGHYDINSKDKANCGRYADDIIATLNSGGVVDPGVTYATPVLPPEWDGRDKIVNGITFFALRRFYVTNRSDVRAKQYADPAARDLRPPLGKGEEFEGVYVTTGADKNLWIVTPYGSRIPMADADPMFGFDA